MNTQLHPAIAVFIRNKQGEVLLQLRQDAKEWGLISGHMEFGETVEAAALREIMEETGREATVIRAHRRLPDPASRRPYHEKGGITHFITLYMECRFTDDQLLQTVTMKPFAGNYFAPDNLPENLLKNVALLAGRCFGQQPGFSEGKNSFICYIYLFFQS